MSEKPLTAQHLPEAVHAAFARVVKDLHIDPGSEKPANWHVTGFVMRDDLGKAQHVADSLAEHAGIGSRGVVLHLDPGHLIVGFLPIESLRALKPELR